MTGIFDLINRRVQQQTRAEHAGSKADAPGEATPEPAGGRAPLQLPTPLPELPAKWILEIQKIVFHLTATTTGEGLPQAIVFSSMQRGVGNTTVSYLVAHHIAAESPDRRVLFVDFSTEKSEAKPATHELIRMDEPVRPELIAPSRQTLSRISVRQEDQQSLAMVSNWCREFLTAARALYDVIIVDAPPFAGSPETYSMAKASDGVVLVMRAGDTRYPAINALATDLGQLGIGMLGAVINYRQYPIPQWLLKFI